MWTDTQRCQGLKHPCEDSRIRTNPNPPSGNERHRSDLFPGDFGFHRNRGPSGGCWEHFPGLPLFDDFGREILYYTNTFVDAYIGDYESVDGVFGTGFWRPPEVLKALKYGSREDLKLAYLPAGDVYGFGMVLYEVLTGRIPLQGHSLNDYDLVISGGRPDIPDDVSPKMRDLLLRCWHQDPHQRPSWTEIEIILLSAP
ncbi:unnamed protein product [Sphagnum jensenii]|jgi:serine/threonine protein kinase|uniref:Protein kinase domain-containing protein n=1 Tax=Sphagnum jensenii TaxID=128206 RepID=A0ABP0WWL7_9BRYO